MQDQLDKIEEKVDRIESKISNIDVTLAKQAKDLEHHIYRTDLAEQSIDMIRQEMQPIKKHVNLVDAALKVMGAVASVVTFCAALYKIIS